MTTPRYVVGILIAASLGVSVAQAASFGHSRMLSGPGQPLHLEIPVTQLTPQEIQSLRAVPAPPEAWQAAGMTPPVPLDSMRLVLLDGFRPDVKVIQLRADQATDQPVIDVLLDVRSASGQQRYQVSLLAHADTHAVQRAQTAATDSARHPRVIDGRAASAPATGHPAAGRQIQVRPGDNMFAIAGRNAVQGVSVYQMMIALQRANSQAFIEDNVNLVRAGAMLQMPDLDTLTALSDREARRIFQQHAQAFAQYRQRSGATGAATLSTLDSAAQGALSETPAALAGAERLAEPSAAGDRLRLSGGPQPPHANAAGGTSLLAGHGAAGTAGASASANGAGAAGEPAVSLLADSGMIASDAVTGRAPLLAAIGNGTAQGAGAAAAQGGASGPATGAGATGAALADDQAATQKGLDDSRTRILELEDNVRHLNEALQKQGHVAAEAALEGARSFTEVIREVMGIDDEDEPAQALQPAAGEGAAVSGAPAAPAASSSPVTPGQGSVSAPQAGNTIRGDAVAPSTPSSAGINKVSWFQENMLAVIGGGLALIVLIVVWLLRRGSATKRTIFESDSPITDSMVRDRLRGIDLDLDSPPSGETGRRIS